VKAEEPLPPPPPPPPPVPEVGDAPQDDGMFSTWGTTKKDKKKKGKIVSTFSPDASVNLDESIKPW
jgi:hypothetical protein